MRDCYRWRPSLDQKFWTVKITDGPLLTEIKLTVGQNNYQSQIKKKEQQQHSKKLFLNC